MANECQIADTKNFISGKVDIMVGYDNLIFGEALPEFGENGLLTKDLKKGVWDSEHPGGE